MSGKEKDLICTVCPRGCALHAAEDENGRVTVTGNACPRGAAYAEAELTHPVRTLTTTVRTLDGTLLSVRTDRPIPKALLFDAMRVLNHIKADPQAGYGDTVLKDLLGTGADVIVTTNRTSC